MTGTQNENTPFPGTLEYSDNGMSRYVELVVEHPSGLSICVLFAQLSLSKTSLIPAFVFARVTVGIICPKGHFHQLKVVWNTLPPFRWALASWPPADLTLDSSE